MNRPDTHTRTGTHTHMGEPRDARDTCMGSPYAYGLRKWPICVWAAHTRMGQPIRVRGKYAYGTEQHYKKATDILLTPPVSLRATGWLLTPSVSLRATGWLLTPSVSLRATGWLLTPSVSLYIRATGWLLTPPVSPKATL